MEEGGQTALGPAMLVAITVASKVPGSKVVMCTDGLANIGLGNLDTESADQHAEASQFYSQLGDRAKQNGCVQTVELGYCLVLFFSRKCQLFMLLACVSQNQLHKRQKLTDL